jgi:hypothetical protein
VRREKEIELDFLIFKFKFYFHGMNFTTTSQETKTYGGFFGMIFSQRPESPLVSVPQRLGWNKCVKNRKSTKKSFIFFSSNPEFFFQNQRLLQERLLLIPLVVDVGFTTFEYCTPGYVRHLLYRQAKIKKNW